MDKSIKGGALRNFPCILGVIVLDEKERTAKNPSDMTLEELLDADVDDLLMDWLKEDLTPEPIPEKKEDAPQKEEPVKEAKQENPEESNWQSSVLMYLHDLVYLLAGLILAFLLLFRVVVVSGTSMNHTLLDGDFLLLLSSTFYHDPQYGDIIVASKESFDDGAPIVKRVIATEGQVVDIDFHAGIVYVDGIPLDEPYTLTGTNAEEGVSFPLTVDEGCLFVMGDNRNGSKDSRHPEIGLVDKREVLGKVFFLFLPGTNTGQEKQDFNRIGVVD